MNNLCPFQDWLTDSHFALLPLSSSSKKSLYLDMLLLLSQQWMEVLNARREIRAVSLDISRAFDTVWHPALLTKLSSYGIQGHLHS